MTNHRAGFLRVVKSLDIVDRLRCRRDDKDCHEAADEIEKLRELLSCLGSTRIPVSRNDDEPIM